MVKLKLIDQVRHATRVRHLSYGTEQAYVSWIKRFIFFHNKRHPNEMDETDVSRFLTFLAVRRHVSASSGLGSDHANRLPLYGRHCENRRFWGLRRAILVAKS